MIPFGLVFLTALLLIWIPVFMARGAPRIALGRCARIYFIDRMFFGRRSCSLQFIDGDGEAMFKVFVGRDGTRELLPHQVARFEALRTQHTD